MNVICISVVVSFRHVLVFAPQLQSCCDEDMKLNYIYIYIMKIILDLRTFFVGPQHVVLRRDRFLNVHLGLRCTRFCFAFFSWWV